MKVLVIKENRMVIRDVHFCLKVRWPDVVVVSAGTGQKGIEMVEFESPDLVIADSSLADLDVAELITRIREFSDVPLIVLAPVQQSDIDKVRCLEAGADDFVGTPFSPIELLTRVRALLRRTWGLGYNFHEDKTISVANNLTVNAGTREVYLSDKPIKLTPIEYRMLLELVKNQGKVVPHEILLERVWGTEYSNETSFVKRYVYRLRRKLELDRSEPLVVSERGIGYRLVKSR